MTFIYKNLHLYDKNMIYVATFSIFVLHISRASFQNVVAECVASITMNKIPMKNPRAAEPFNGCFKIC